MSDVNMAISLEESLFERLEGLSRQLKMARNQLIGQALEEFIQHHEDRELLDEINRSVDEGMPDPEGAGQPGGAGRVRPLDQDEW